MPEHTPAPTPSRAIYGFVLFLLFKTFFILYVLWAFIPTEIFEEYFGITYLPNKYFALYIPILILTATTLFAFFIYPSFGMIMTPNIDDSATIWDEHTTRRCKYMDLNNVSCDAKILVERLKGWHVSKYCEYHQYKLKSNKDFKEDNRKNYVEDYCDCPVGQACILKMDSNYIHKLRNLKTIENAADLDISEVSNLLYRPNMK